MKKFNSKKVLFLGIILLVVGILLKKIILMNVLGLILIITGVTLKAIYILAKVKSGEYKPEKELYLLAIGLLLFFTGLYLKNIGYTPINPIYFIVLGLSLKVLFIIGFMRIVRAKKS